jgi:hypothetical protein
MHVDDLIPASAPLAPRHRLLEQTCQVFREALVKGLVTVCQCEVAQPGQQWSKVNGLLL